MRTTFAAIVFVLAFAIVFGCLRSYGLVAALPAVCLACAWAEIYDNHSINHKHNEL